MGDVGTVAGTKAIPEWPLINGLHSLLSGIPQVLRDSSERIQEYMRAD